MKGMSRRVTPEGWTVHRVHYSADADKDPATPRGREWYAQARKGMRDRDFRKEFEIDYGALGGQLVFPGFDESTDVVMPYLPLDERYWTTYLGADPHPRRAHAFVWLCVNKYGKKVVPWSWWPEELNRQREDEHKSRLLIKDYVEGLVDVQNAKLFPPSWIEVMDSAGKNFDADEEHNFFDAYADLGAYFQPAKKNREWAGYELIDKAFTPKEWTFGDETVMEPELTIMAGMGHNSLLIEQIKNLRFREHKTTMTDKDPPSDPMDKDRHLVDCLSYILLHEPTFIEPGRKRSAHKPLYPKLGY